LRIAHLGPAGTFTEDALREAAAGLAYDPLRTATVPEAILAVQDGDADRALVPIENSIEGSVRPTLDTLAFEAEAVRIVGEHDFAVRANLIARRQIDAGEIAAVLSHPQPLAQCARYLRRNLPDAELRAVDSTAEAVRIVSESEEPLAAIGAASAASLYRCAVLEEGIEDEPNNVTRFVWIAREGMDVRGRGPWRTSLVFAELGEDHPGALVDALREFSSRDINLSRIESRPMRQGLGRYMFFCDLDGSSEDAEVAAAIAALRTKADSVRVLGSYPVA
jgi:prephenate dehydratase